jgi:DNA-binding MarR family transcriptional regulator
MSADSAEPTGFLVVDLARLFRQHFERLVASEGLEVTAGEARTLLYASYGLERQSALAERMRVEPMTLSNFLDRLERRGFIRREADPQDRRAKRIRITDKAKPLLKRIRAIAAIVRERAVSGLSAGEIEAMRRALNIMCSNLSEGAERQAA